MRFICLLLLTLMFMSTSLIAQEYDKDKVYIITKNDGSFLKGRILSSDAREVLIETESIGQVIIPKHEIKLIKEFQVGDDRFKEIFASRYFVTTNALPVEKGESYIQYQLFGPDFQFGVADNFGVGLITTWVASPVLLSGKYTFELTSNLRGMAGTLVGGNLYSLATDGFIALPFAGLTYGNSSANINFSFGYGYSRFEDSRGGQMLYSVGGMKKLTRKGTLIFDSFILPVDGEVFALIMPGIRLQTQEKSAFQFGFPGFVRLKNGQSEQVAFPLVSWFRQL